MNRVALEPLEAVAEDPTIGSSAMQATSSAVFGFESDLERNLTCIPLAVRFKLDDCAIKLCLGEWQQRSIEDRQGLLRARCDSQVDIADYRCALQASVLAISDREPRALNVGTSRSWEDRLRPRHNSGMP